MCLKKGDLLLFDPPQGSAWLVLGEEHEGRNKILAMQTRLPDCRSGAQIGTLYAWRYEVIQEWVEKGYVTCISGEEKSEE